VRIAIIEDDLDIGSILRDWLVDAHHSVHLFPTGKAAQREISRESFDLFVMDWQLPDITGDEVLKFIRATVDHWVPVIFVTSRDTEDDIVTALRLGADDYMIKPVRRMELLARIEALSRRMATTKEEVLSIPPYRIVSQTRQIFVRDVAVELTDKEYELAVFLFKNVGQLLSRGHISESVWGRGEEVLSRTIDTHVSRLRKKLEILPDNGFRLSPVYNFGYRFERLGEPVM
jgi:two-component system, OmpR family, response regulator RegX3